MILANKPYLVSAPDQGADSFFVPLSTGRLMVQLPIASNTLKVLRPLAKWLNFPGAPSEKKDTLLAGIEQNLSLLPMEDAVARWPQLAGPIPETTSLTLAAYRAHHTEAWAVALRRETPQFIPHLHVKIVQLAEAERTQHSQEMYAWMHASDPPKWREDAMDVLDWRLKGKPHYEITVAETAEDHDGYCSGVEEEDWDETDLGNRTLYLQADDWAPSDLNKKMEWDESLPGHTYCSAGKHVRMMGWTLVKE